MTVLQHRGQDAAGMVTAATDIPSKFRTRKANGMVRDVFQPEHMRDLSGNSGIGHTRYPTSGTALLTEAQPLYLNYPCGIALAHNGNLTNDSALRGTVQLQHRHLNTESDSEVLLNIFAEELRKQLDLRSGERSAKVNPEMVFAAVKTTMNRCRGGYAVVMMIHNVGIVGFRDPWGIRPICLGRRKSSTLDGGVDYALCSESVGLDTLGFELMGDVKPGECVVALPMEPCKPRENEGLYRAQLVGNGSATPCIFEYVYFARPDSIMNGVSVYESRLLMGEKLALKIQRLFPENDIDAVIPVPDTSRTSALQCAATLGKPYREGFIKNRYIGRTFIMPGQATRKKSVRLKLNTMRSEFEGRNVLLVDDSIVRGTTSKELVSMARDAGAAKVYFVSAAPEVRFQNVYGIDLPCKEELIAHNRTPEEVAAKIGADWVVYQDLADLEDCVRSLNPELTRFESSTFCGDYVTEDVDAEYFSHLAKRRNDAAKEKKRHDSA